MKVIFKYFLSHAGVIYGHAPVLWTRSVVIDAPKEGFEKYLLSALDTDFNQNREGLADRVLEAIEKLERREILSYETGGNGFCHSFSDGKVTFEHSVFGECPDWPLWSCSLSQYKSALQGWRKFIEMPKSIDTELIVDLPDDLV